MWKYVKKVFGIVQVRYWILIISIITISILFPKLYQHNLYLGINFVSKMGSVGFATNDDFIGSKIEMFDNYRKSSIGKADTRQINSIVFLKTKQIIYTTIEYPYEHTADPGLLMVLFLVVFLIVLIIDLLYIIKA